MQIKFLSIVALFFGIFRFQAPLQAQPLQPKAGEVEFGAQLGLLSTYRVDRATTLVPPLQVQGAYFATANLSAGAFLSYVEAEGDRIYTGAAVAEHYHNQTWAVGLRTTAYSNLLAEKWRIYGGVAIGATLPSVETTINVQGELQGDQLPLPRFSTAPTNSFLFTGYVGAQYYLTPSLSLTGEAGYGLSLLNVGLRYKL